MKPFRNLLEDKSIFQSLAGNVANHPFVKNIRTSFPRLFSFLINRFTLSKFNGLPLTLLLIAFVANLSLFFEIIEKLENSKLLLSIDQAFAQFLYSVRIQELAQAFFYFSKLGAFPYVISIALIAGVVYWVKREYVYIISMIIALIGTGLTVSIGKIYFHRIRPENFSFYHESLYSFPSGHATTAMAFYGLLFYSIIRDAKNYRSKFKWLMIAILFISLLGFSRLYLCVHYLSDVFAGYSLGLLWLLLAISIVEWKLYRRGSR